MEDEQMGILQAAVAIEDAIGGPSLRGSPLLGWTSDPANMSVHPL